MSQPFPCSEHFDICLFIFQLGTTVLMGEIVGLHDVQCCAEDADKDTVYETLKKGRKEESHYAHIISLTDKPADDNLPPKALSDGKSFYLLKILYIVLTIVIIVSTATTIALIHELVRGLYCFNESYH